MSHKQKVQEKSPYSRKGLLVEVFREEAKTQTIRNRKCYNDAAMKTHQQIAEEAIGFKSRPVTPGELEKIKRVNFARKKKKERSKP